jgi:hypothetical protein
MPVIWPASALSAVPTVGAAAATLGAGDLAGEGTTEGAAGLGSAIARIAVVGDGTGEGGSGEEAAAGLGRATTTALGLGTAADAARF